MPSVDAVATALGGVDLNANAATYTPLNRAFVNLATVNGWAKGSVRYKEERTRFLREELNRVVPATQLKLEILQEVCRDIGLKTVPENITQCKKALKTVYINIFDFLDCRKRGVGVTPVFRNYREFVQYSRGNDKVYPLAGAKGHEAAQFLLKRLT